MTQAFLSILIVLLIGTAAFYAALYVLTLRNRLYTVTDEYKRAEDHIKDLEARVELLDAQLDLKQHPIQPTGDTSGWSTFEARR